MPDGKGINGIGVAAATAGAYLMYIGIRDVGPLEGLREITSGRLPAGNTERGVLSPAIDAARQALADAQGAAAQSSAQLGAVTGGRTGLAAAALKYQGVPYRWGGTTPAGLDCSGLVQLSFHDIGVKAPRTTYAQQPWGKLTTIPRASAGTDDLVFWPGHVAIMVSATTVVHAPHPGTVVRLENVNSAGPVGTSPVFKRYTGGGVKAPGGGAGDHTVRI